MVQRRSMTLRFKISLPTRCFSSKAEGSVHSRRVKVDSHLMMCLNGTQVQSQLVVDLDEVSTWVRGLEYTVTVEDSAED